MADDKSNVDQRIQNSIYGTPKIKPDEQRKYMGTFRERVHLTISVAEAKQQDWSGALQKELTKHPDSLVIINGNLEDRYTRAYITIANQMTVQFTIKTGNDTKTDDDAFAVVVTDHQAVYESPVDVAKKYGDQNQTSSPEENHEKRHESIWHRLFHN